MNTHVHVLIKYSEDIFIQILLIGIEHSFFRSLRQIMYNVIIEAFTKKNENLNQIIMDPSPLLMLYVQLTPSHPHTNIDMIPSLPLEHDILLTFINFFLYFLLSLKCRHNNIILFRMPPSYFFMLLLGRLIIK